METNVLLLGGNGFLGLGLQEELIKRKIKYKSIDKYDYDLVNYINLGRCIEDLKAATHVVILASKIGIDLFNTDPISASKYNKLIHNFVIDAIKIASKKYNKSFNVTYYSTSETYGSLENKDDIITEHTPYNFIQDNDRYLYAYVKYEAETEYFKLNFEHPEIVSSIKILHPFNIFGKNQKRGVVYKMIESVLDEHVIRYNVDTTRTLTGLNFASRMSVDAILSDVNGHINIVDKYCSLTLKSLAQIIAELMFEICGIKDIEFIQLPPDNLIRYRHVSKPDYDVLQAKSIMYNDIYMLIQQLKFEHAIMNQTM